MDSTKVKALSERVLADTGGAFAVALAYIGDKLGLFRALAGAGPISSGDLAKRTNLNERYVREWLNGLVAAEYLELEPESGRTFMTEEQAAVFANEGGPSFLAGASQFTIPTILHVPEILEAFRKGGGVSFATLGEEVAEGIDRLHRPAFEHQLVPEWLPAVPGLKERLDAGISILDVGCGLARSSIAIASAWPRSRVAALDPDPYSIRRARELAGGLKNLDFLTTSLEGLPEDARYDLILAFDCVHDMIDPVGGLKEIRRALRTDGMFLWVEPTGSHDPLENRNPVDRMRACLSPLHCLTVSLADGGAGLGTIIGEKGARDLAGKAGFSAFERVPIRNRLQQFFLLRP